MSKEAIVLSEGTWQQIKRLIDSVVIGSLGNHHAGSEHGAQVASFIKTTEDLTTYDEDTGDVVETDGYTYIYKGVMSWYNAKAQEWVDETGPVKVVGPNDEMLDVGKRYYCVAWDWDGDVDDNSTTLSDDFPLDEDGNEVAPIWMPIYPTTCQEVVKCDETGPHIFYGQLPMLHENSDCTDGA